LAVPKLIPRIRCRGVVDSWDLPGPLENHRKTIGKPYENGDLMRVYGGLMGFNGI